MVSRRLDPISGWEISSDYYFFRKAFDRISAKIDRLVVSLSLAK